MKVLIETNSNIGDAVMNVPIINFLIQQYPDVSIDLVGDERSVDIFKDFQAVKNIYVKNKKSKKAKMKLFFFLRKTNYDLAIGLRSEGIPLLVRAKKKIYKFDKDKRLLNKTSETEYTFSCLKKIFPQIRFEDINQHIAISDMTLDEIKTLIQFRENEKMLVVAPGANAPGKIWLQENFIELIHRIKQPFDKIIILGSSTESDICSAIAEKTGGLDLSGKTTLRQIAGLCTLSRLFIGNDSGLGHIAAAQGTPTLAIFAHLDIAMGNPVRYAPYRQHAIFRRSNDEAPISVDDVVNKLVSSGLLPN